MQAIHTDGLGRPEAVTDANRDVVWRARNFAFDCTVTLSTSASLNIGFPGQYYDAESGLWNNGFRDYSPSLGRYIESDPLGLEAGINTYAYVDGSPLLHTDPLGLEWQASVGFGVTGAFLFGGLGGSVNFTLTSNGQLSFSATGQAELGLGGYLGAGFTGGISHTKCDSAAGASSSVAAIAEADAGYGPSAGGAVTYAGGQDAGASTGLGKYGVGAGVWVGAGAARTYSYTTPTISQMATSAANAIRSW